MSHHGTFDPRFLVLGADGTESSLPWLLLQPDARGGRWGCAVLIARSHAVTTTSALSRTSTQWNVYDMVRVRRVRNHEGRFGMVVGILGNSRVEVLVEGDKDRNGRFVRTRIKARQRQLERVDIYDVYEGVSCQSCDVLQSTPATYGGAADGTCQAATPEGFLTWLPRTASLRALEVNYEDPQVCAKLIQGDFSFYAKEYDDGIFCIDVAVLGNDNKMSMVVRISNAWHDDRLLPAPISESNRPFKILLSDRILHHIIRQHGKSFSTSQLGRFRSQFGHSRTPQQQAMSPKDLLDAQVALFDSQSRFPHFAHRFRDLKQIAFTAQRAKNFWLAANIYHHLSSTSNDSQLLSDAEACYAKVAVASPGESAVSKLTGLRVCYQQMGTPEAATMNLALSSLLKVAGSETVEQGATVVAAYDHLRLSPRFNSRKLIERALKKKFRKPSKAIEMMNHIATATSVSELRDRIRDCLDVNCTTAVLEKPDSDPFECLDVLLHKMHADWKRRNTCASCGRFSPRERFQCCPCLGASYCSKKCQRAHWEAHQHECSYHNQLADAFAGNLASIERVD